MTDPDPEQQGEERDPQEQRDSRLGWALDKLLDLLGLI